MKDLFKTELILRILVLTCISITAIFMSSLLLKITIWIASIGISTVLIMLFFFGASSVYFGMLYDENFIHIKTVKKEDLTPVVEDNKEEKSDSL